MNQTLKLFDISHLMLNNFSLVRALASKAAHA